MSLELVDGFDQYALDEDQMLDGNWTQLVRTNLTQDAEKVRTGTTALEFESTVLTTSARRNFEFQDTSKIVCFAFRVTTNLPASKHRLRICTFSDSDNENQVGLFVMTTGQLRAAIYLANGDIGPAIQSTTPLVSVGNYHSIQMKVVIDDTIGSIDVRIDNETVVWDGANTGLDTDQTGYGSSGQFEFGGEIAGGIGTAPTWTLDDVFVINDAGSINNDFTGDKQAFLLLPDGNDTTQDWSVTGAATAWEAISEVPADGDTSYIEATSVNDISEFDIEDIDSSIIDIIGVQMTQVARKLDAGAATLQGSLLSNAAVATGTDRSITENYAHWNDIIEQNPDGPVDWTPTTWNAATYRIEKTS